LKKYVHPKRRGLKTLVLVPIDTMQNIFEFGQGLTPPVGAQKWPFEQELIQT
jgi:hypothetical protein